MANPELDPFQIELQNQINKKTAEMISVKTPDATPVGLDRQVRILSLHREIKDLIDGGGKIEINTEVEG